MAGAVYLVAPQTFGAALPVLLVLACPLSMVLMMRAMNGGHSYRAEEAGTTATRSDAATTIYPAVDEAEAARMRAEIDQLRAELRARQRDGADNIES
ncbi:MAG: DUF2933 domain-containing protein [Acidimicrobiales bacterium]